MLLERGIVVSYETVRRWAMKFGREYSRRLRRKRPSRSDIWHLDEVIVTIGGKKYWLWRAVDQDGYILDEIVQTRRDTKAARRLLRRLLKKQGGRPWRMITDKLGSYAAARRQIMPAVEHRSHKGLNNRAKNSHQPTRRRGRFKSPSQVQRFLSIHDQLANSFPPPRPRHRRKVSFRTQPGIRHLGRGYRRGDGCVIMPVDNHCSTHRGHPHLSDHKLTVLSWLYASIACQNSHQ